MTEHEVIAARVIRYRKANSVSQEEFAARCGLAVSRLREIEHKRGNPRIETLERMAEQMGITLADLLDVEKGA